MAVEIRNNNNIKGIKIEKKVSKICQLADDTTLFINDIKSIETAFEILKQFQNRSGLKINMEKTEIIPIGTSK